jgi:cell division protein DivIC
MDSKKLRAKAISLIKNKYVISLLVLLVWLLFFDRNNLVDRYKDVRNLKQLKEEKDYYKEKTQTTHKRLNELETDKENLEKFAREQYLMKKEDEDIFVIIEDE